ncbi:protein phosphatase 1L-like [Pollicipes pollicipes]|uniref:protein phosphatase 1L-like n=1 Tax=Pollicipes pollicipes TaxID=41117 RepID=UPI0018852585|nr:protein phosphatase 1L-like [Pollicipes pollicipes]
MEDRFAAEEEIALGARAPGEEQRDGRGLSIYAVYDGHGGDFAAEYTKDHLIEALKAKLLEVHVQRGRAADVGEPSSARVSISISPAEPEPEGEREPAGATLGSCKSHEAYQRTRSPRRSASAQGDMLVNFFGQINYTKVMQDVFSEVDAALLDAARREACIAGTTAVLALVDGDQVVVASCGDSRAVLCDARGHAVPLTTDHKPDQLTEKKRITEAGGFVTFNGVWRVNGILATSRALGDLPFKERRLLTCRPDVQTVSVRHHAAPFLLLASDGLWDAASGQEAVQHVRARLHEPDLGARSLALLAYQRGSLDNITVLVVDLRPGQLGRSGSFRRAAAS